MELHSALGSSPFEIRDEVIAGATLLQVGTGTHPINIIRNVDWADRALNRRTRTCGFPKITTLLELKQYNIESVETNDSGSGPDGQGWAVRWPLFPKEWDSEQKYTLEDLAYCLEQCPLERSREEWVEVSSWFESWNF